MQDYRHEVFARTLAELPQPIPSQILRTRLAAFKRELSDQNLRIVLRELRDAEADVQAPRRAVPATVCGTCTGLACLGRRRMAKTS